MNKKVVLKLGVEDEREKKRALKAVASLAGIESLSMDMNAKKLTIIGEVDAIKVVGKLKKSCGAVLLTVGPAEKKKAEAEKTQELWNNHYTQSHYSSSYSYTTSTEEDPTSCVIS